MSLSVRSVGHEYVAGTPVLSGIEMEVVSGESVALMGPSGSGKTTLLAIMGMLLVPSEGSVSVDGVEASSAADRQRLRFENLGWVFQTVNVLGRRTPVDNVVIPLLARGVDRDEAERLALEALDSVGLGGKRNGPARLLSGGEVQRLCVARALVSKPKYLLADEPTGQLDQHTSVEVLDRMWGLLSESGAGLVVATHDPLVSARCDRVVRLVDGEAII